MSAAPVRKAKQRDERAADPSELATDNTGVCDHCGDSLSGLKVVHKTIAGPGGAQTRAFCCLGCAFIAEQLALAQASARDRAGLEAAAGIDPQETPSRLDRAQFDVDGMVCAACGLLIEHRLRRVLGVAQAHVDFPARRAFVTFDPQRVAEAELAATIERTGYRVGLAQDERARQRARRVELARVLLAWLAMMQVMMLAVPASVAAPGEIPADIEQLLRIGQLILATPVMLFSAVPLWRAAFSQLRTGSVGMDLPIALGLGAAFAASLSATVAASGAVYFDSITMFAALVLGVRWLQARALAEARAHVDTAQRRAALSAQRLRAYPASTVTDTVAAAELAVGDKVRVAPGETVPADGIVIEGTSTVSQAWLTGEATPLEKHAGQAVLAGCINIEQPLVIEVTRAGEETSLAALGRMVDDAGRERPRTVELANKVAGAFLWVVLAITLLTVFGWWLVDPAQALPNAIAVLVATCPCALSLAAPAALAVAQARLARRGVLTARVAAFEPLAQVDTVACDKTGTLTAAEPVLTRVVATRTLAPPNALAVAAALDSLSAHPFARALARAAKDAGVVLPAIENGHVESGAGVEATVGGVRLRLGKTDYALGLGRAERTEQKAALAQLLQKEQLGGASTIVLADESGPLAVLAFGEMPRPDAHAFVQGNTARGMQTVVVSGDRRATVEALAQKLGAAASYPQQTPASKRALIAGMQRDGHVVAMVGDGINDAPVLAQADVSFAFAEGAALAQSRADFIVLSPRLADVAASFVTARRALRIVRQNLTWALAYNLTIVPLAALGFVTPALAAAGMAASSLLVVGNALRVR
jgi:Cu2+-exporting ATPase